MDDHDFSQVIENCKESLQDHELPPIVDVDGENNKVVHLSNLIDDVNTFRQFHFRNCSALIIMIDIKVVRCTFYNCNETCVFIKENVIGCIEYIRSHSCSLMYNKGVELPYIQCDESSNLAFYSQEETPTERLYVCAQCIDFKTYWNDDEHIIPVHPLDGQRVILMKDNGSYDFMERRQLDSVSEQHFMFAPPPPEDF